MNKKSLSDIIHPYRKGKEVTFSVREYYDLFHPDDPDRKPVCISLSKEQAEDSARAKQLEVGLLPSKGLLVYNGSATYILPEDKKVFLEPIESNGTEEALITALAKLSTTDRYVLEQFYSNLAKFKHK